MRSEIVQKSIILLDYVKRCEKKEVNLNNLRNHITAIRYVLKYLSKYPAQFKDVFVAWLAFIKNFLLKCDKNLKVHCLTQISVVLMHSLRVKFRPISLIEDVLSHWLEILLVVPSEVTAKVLDERSQRSLNTVLGALKSIGHFKYQALLVEILFRYLASVSREVRFQTIVRLFEGVPGGAVGDQSEKEEAMRLLSDLDAGGLEWGIRRFLNQFNRWCASSVSTYQVISVAIDGVPVPSPTHEQQWVDCNLRHGSLSFYGASTGSLWNYFEVPRDSVSHLSKGPQNSVSLDLCAPLVLAYCEDDENHRVYGEHHKNVSIRFSSWMAQEEFFSVAQSLLCPKIAEAPPESDWNASNTTLNLSVTSHGVQNGSLLGRFSFMGDPHDSESEPDPPSDPVVPKKRKLYSHEAFEVQESLPGTQEKSPSEASLEIVFTEKESRNPPTETSEAPSKCNKETTGGRVPIYKRIIADWESDSSYTFVSKDPEVPREQGKRKRTPANAANKTAPVRDSKVGSGSKRNWSSATKKRTPALVKRPLNFVRTLMKRPCREAAQEAKKIFALQNTPPYHGEEESVTGPITTGKEPQETHTVHGVQLITGGSDSKEVSGVPVAGTAAEETPSSESCAVFMKFLHEYRTLSTQMGDLMRNIRRMRTQVANSKRLTDYQKAALLMELFNFLLNR